jgi:putative transposase
MCRVMGVSRSGFYRWQAAGENNRQQRRKKLEAAVILTFKSYKARYGAPRITRELNALGIQCCVNAVARLMQQAGIKARNGKSFKYSPSAEAIYGVADNQLNRRFSAGGPNRKWTTDITYIWVKDKWLYLAAVMDLYSRKIVGWSLDTTMTEQLITRALEMAFAQRNIQPGLMIHSDRGVQYRATRYQSLIRRNGCEPSMSRQGNCWDNAAMESFFSRLKVELVYAERFQSLDQARSSIFEYIEMFYNRTRRHSALGYLSPAKFEEVNHH